MAASTASAIKSLIESAGLGISAFRDDAPENSPLPHATVTEAVSVVPESTFNPLNDSTGHVSELAQVDLWQQWHKADGTLAESYTLASQLVRVLHGSRVPASPTQVFQCSVVDQRRIIDRNALITARHQDTNMIHHAITVRLRRVL